MNLYEIIDDDDIFFDTTYSNKFISDNLEVNEVTFLSNNIPTYNYVNESDVAGGVVRKDNIEEMSENIDDYISSDIFHGFTDYEFQVSECIITW